MKAYFSVMIFAGVLAACQPSVQAPEVRVVPVPHTPLTTEPRLELLGPAVVKIGENTLEFSVTDYQLGVPTETVRASEIAVSPNGQHIHVLVNNAPYMAHYDSRVKVDLDSGNQVVLAFLSRSYHESIKHPKAYVLKLFSTTINDSIAIDMSEGKHLFYSRPKGEYLLEEGTDTPVLLDFYLVNTQLEDGLYVEMTLDGKQYQLGKWQPYYLYGLQAGEHEIVLSLKDSLGRPIPGPFNQSETRKFYIKNQ